MKDPAELAPALARYLAVQLDAPTVEVRELRRVLGGSSRETWSFDAVFERSGSTQRLPLILRRDPGAAAMQTSRRDEFRLLQAAHAAGVAVPRAYWLGDESDTLGARFFVMERIEGETLGRRLLRDDEYAGARAAMTGQLGAILARIHAIDVAKLEFLGGPAAEESAAQCELDRYEQIFRFVAPDPHSGVSFAWCRRNPSWTGRPATSSSPRSAAARPRWSGSCWS